MPMQDEHRRAYLQRAGVSHQQIEETVGEAPLHEASYQAHGLSREQAEDARAAIRRAQADAAIIAAKYSAIAQRGENIEATVGADEVATDRRHLEELFAEGYTLLNPFGEEQDRSQVITAMLSGMIAYDGMGRAGFEAQGQSLRVHGETATLTGDYTMSATGRAKSVETGEVFQQDLGGTYRITNTYVRRDGRWQAATSQMTTIPADRTFVLTPDE